MEETDRRDHLSFTRIGSNGMQVEVKGNADTLRSMFRAAMMEHHDMRKLLIPVIMDILKDEDFLKLGLDDALRAMRGEDQEDLTLDTE